jgi:hypothetical protein
MVTTWSDASATWSDASAAWAYPGVTELGATFEWSPTTAPGEAPVWVDFTERVRGGSIQRGRQSEFDRTSAGRLSLTVDNRDREFDPEHNANARVNKRVRVSVGSSPDIVYVFDGWIDQLPQTYDPPNDAVVELTATDGFKLLARHELDPIYGSVLEADAPWGWWRLADDLPTATVVADASGNDRTGSWKGTPSSTGSLLAAGPGGVKLDGSGDNIEGSADGAVVQHTLFAAPVSIECWVKTGKFGLNSSFICGQTHVVGSTFVHDFSLVMNNATGVPQFLALVGGIGVARTGTTDLRDTGIHHLVGTVDSSRVCRLYVDGVQQGGDGTAGSTTTIDGTGSFRIGKTPVGSDPGSGSAYKSFDGEICEVAVWDRALSGAEISEHYTAGAAPWANDTSGVRVGRILSLVGWRTGEREIETGASVLGPAPSSVEGASALDHLLKVEETEQGRFFIAGDGTATFFGRNHKTTTAVASFTDADYTDLEFDYSEANLVNDMTVTREGGLPQRAVDQDSIDAYWRSSDTMSGLLYSTDNEAKAMAEWRVGNQAVPTLRPTGLTFVPVGDLPDLFPRVLARELGDRISVTRELTGTDVTVDAVIEGIRHDFRPRWWETSWNLSPLTYGTFGPGGGHGYSYLTLGDATLGQLDNNNRLGF